VSHARNAGLRPSEHYLRPHLMFADCLSAYM
jgi:hypothetical protein